MDSEIRSIEFLNRHYEPLGHCDPEYFREKQSGEAV